jgi:hypothetical protein
MRRADGGRPRVNRRPPGRLAGLQAMPLTQLSVLMMSWRAHVTPGDSRLRSSLHHDGNFFLAKKGIPYAHTKRPRSLPQLGVMSKMQGYDRMVACLGQPTLSGIGGYRRSVTIDSRRRGRPPSRWSIRRCTLRHLTSSCRDPASPAASRSTAPAL